MGAYEINTPGKKEFQNFGSQEELDAAKKFMGMDELGGKDSLQVKAEKGAAKISSISRDLGWAGIKDVTNQVAEKNTQGLANNAVATALEKGKSNENKLTKEEKEVGSWEQNIKKSKIELSYKQKEALYNLSSLQIKDRDLIVSLIDDLEDKIEEYNREYIDTENFNKTIKTTNGVENLYEYLEKKINQETQTLNKVRKIYTQLFQKGLTLNIEEKQAVRGMDAGDFLRQYSREERLKFVTLSGEEGNVGKVKSLTFTFSYDGVFNRELYTKLTAGQVLPKDVSSVKYGNVEYTRSSLLGEFFNANGRRLKIGEGTNITSIQYRSEKEIGDYEKGLDKKLEGLPNDLKDNFIAQEAVKRGIEPQLLIDIVGDAINLITDKGYQRAALEEELTSFERFKGNYGVGNDTITQESIRSNNNHKKVIAALFNQVNGKEQGWYGEREFAKKNGYENVYQQSIQALEKNYGISSEVLGETTLGKRIVDHLAKRGYRPYEGQAYNCGKNVGEALKAIGIVGQGIPHGGRDGKKWGGFMEQRPDFQESAVDARNAPAGSVISYQPVEGKGSGPRQEYGHVEIALGNGKFWFGTKNPVSTPGGSYGNPPRNTYRVFVPKGSAIEGENNEEKKVFTEIEAKNKNEELFGYVPNFIGLLESKISEIQSKVESNEYLKNVDLESDGSLTKFVTRGKGIKNKDQITSQLVRFNTYDNRSFSLENPKKNSIREGLRGEAKYGLELLGRKYFSETGKRLNVVSGYRDMDDPAWKNRTITKERARSHESEHALGLAVDLFSVSSSDFKSGGKFHQEGEWLKKNIHTEGYIIPYSKGEKVDGYSQESWHIRYVGKKLASFLHENNISFAQFYKIKQLQKADK